MRRLLFLLIIAALPRPQAGEFSAAIAPILQNQCVTCHGPEKSKGGYRVDTYARLLKPGESGKPSIQPGSAAQSHLFQRLVTTDEEDRMPQKAERLSVGQIAAVEKWIASGAPFDGASPDQPIAQLAPAPAEPAAPVRYPFPVPVLAIAWSPDGALLATSGYHEILVWSASDGALRHRLGGLPQRIHGLAFLPDGKTVAVAAGTPGKTGLAALCPLDGGSPQILARHSDELIALALAPDGSRLAVGGSDQAIRIFSLPSGAAGKMIQQHADWVTSLAFSSDGKKLLSASRDRTARVFAASTGELEETYTGHAQPLFAAIFLADGRQAVSAGREKTIHNWSVLEAKKEKEWPGLEADVLKLALAGERLFIAGAAPGIREFNLAERQPGRLLEGHSDWVYALACHAPSARLASGGYDGEIRLWDIAGGSTVRHWRASP